MIELDGVSYSYDSLPALRSVSLRIKKGTACILRGPNGCGKTTLLKLLNGLIFPTSGRYIFDGTEITAKNMKDPLFCRHFHQKVGFVFQNPDVQLFCPNVEEEIAFGPRQMNLPREEVERRVNDTIHLMGLENLRTRAPYHLSGGEKKKTAIACVLSMNPSVWTLDEPLNGLDEESRQHIMEFMKSLKMAGKTLIISTHDEEVSRELGDFVATMDASHTIAQIAEY